MTNYSKHGNPKEVNAIQENDKGGSKQNPNPKQDPQ